MGQLVQNVQTDPIVPADGVEPAANSVQIVRNFIPDGASLFQTLRVLESEGSFFGRGDSPDKEPARLSQIVRLTFATSEISGIDWDHAPAPKVQLTTLGLLGPEGPLPLHLTRAVLDRMSQRWFSGADGMTSDTGFADFCDMLQHRAITLIYRAWADTRPEVQIERANGGRIRTMLAALAGVGLPGLAGALQDLEPIALRQAPSLARAPLSPDKLIHFLEDAVRAPIRLAEYVGNRVRMGQQDQTQLGAAHARLGQTAMLGPRVFLRENRYALNVGPLSLDTYRRFLPGGDLLERLQRAVLFVAGQSQDVDLRLSLAADAVPPSQLGAVQLGRTAWLASNAASDRSDMVLYHILQPKPGSGGRS